MTWEEFKEKKYYLYQMAEEWEKDTPGMRKFYEDPEKNPAGDALQETGVLFRAAGQALPG